jgi:DNA (cytosine-5)-methyltransferase 1
MGLNEVLSDLADKANYAVQTFHLGAVSVDARHRRMRIFIVARNVADADNSGDRASRRRTDSIGQKVKQGQEKQSQSKSSGSRKDVADAASTRLQGAKWSEHEGNRNGLTTSSQDVADAISARGETWASDTVGDGDGSRSNKKQPKSSGSKADVADTASKRQQGSRLYGRPQHQAQNKNGQANRADNGSQGDTKFWVAQSKLGGMVNGLSRWVDEPRDIPRVSKGVPNRVQRLKGLGNAIVPSIAMRIGQTIKAVEETT